MRLLPNNTNNIVGQPSSICREQHFYQIWTFYDLRSRTTWWYWTKRCADNLNSLINHQSNNQSLHLLISTVKHQCNKEIIWTMHAVRTGKSPTKLAARDRQMVFSAENTGSLIAGISLIKYSQQAGQTVQFSLRRRHFTAMTRRRWTDLKRSHGSGAADWPTGRLYKSEHTHFFLDRSLKLVTVGRSI